MRLHQHPGEGPDCHFLKEIGGFGPIPARILGFLILILASSTAGIMVCIIVFDVSFHFLFSVFGDLVSGPWGSIPGPGEGHLRGFWTPETNKN